MQEERVEREVEAGLTAREFALWTSAFVLGVIVGGALGVLLAPKAGREVREQLKERMREKTHQVKERLREAAERAKQKFAEVRERMEAKEEKPCEAEGAEEAEGEGMSQ
ncbi:MAG TPA: YtxH domain-containing protein [Armatimonadetes bacterium]|nr:YtxH domain-containing protein [Armatimonadota bacterium]